MRTCLCFAFALLLSGAALMPQAQAQPQWQSAQLASVDGRAHLAPVVTSSPQGVPMAAWRSASPGRLTVASWDGQQWVTQGTLVAAEVGFSVFQGELAMVATADAVHVVSRVGNNAGTDATRTLLHATLRDGQWSTQNIAVHQNNAGAVALSDPALALGPQGNLVVAYSVRNAANQSVTLNLSSFIDNTWQTIPVHTETGASALMEDISLAIDDQNAPHLALTHSNADRREIIYVAGADIPPTIEVVADRLENIPLGTNRLVFPAGGGVRIFFNEASGRDVVAATGPGQWSLQIVDGQDTVRGRGVAASVTTAGQLLAYLDEPSRNLIVNTTVGQGQPVVEALVNGVETTPALGTHITSDNLMVVVSQHWLPEATELRTHVAPLNQDPVIDQGEAVEVTMSEDGAPTAFALTLTATDTDALTWRVSSPASTGLASAEGQGESQEVTYAPPANFNGTDSFVVEVSDSQGATDTITVNVVIEAVNDAPVVDQGGRVAVTMSEDGAPTAFEALLTAQDLDNGPMELLWSLVTDANNGQATANAIGPRLAPSYQPQANFNGTDSFVVSVQDPSGASDTVTVDVTIEPVNDAPTAILFEAAAISADADADILAGTLSAQDIDSQSFTFEIVAGDGDTDNALFSINGVQVVTAEALDPQRQTPYSIRVQVSDGADTFAQSLTITPVLVPVARDDAFEATEGQTLTVATPGVRENDLAGQGQGLRAVVVDGPQNGALELAADGGFTYTPTDLFNGTDTFTYRLEDDQETSPPATVTLTVGAVNNAPFFVAPTPEEGTTLEGVEGDALTFEIRAEDPDSDPITLAAGELPPGAAFDADTGVYSHTPTLEEVGLFDLTFTATDGQETITRSLSIDIRFLDADEDGLPGTLEELLAMNRNDPDSDGDTIGDFEEVDGDANAPTDTDEDQTIDALDEDSDNDTISDRHEAGDEDLQTPAVDTDEDDVPDYRDEDSDDDGLTDAQEAGDDDIETEPVDTDDDGVPDFQDTDSDDDGVEDGDDNCVLVANPDQEDSDADGVGDACTDLPADRDEDGVPDEEDNCPDDPNPGQEDEDGDGVGDVCDGDEPPLPDRDEDGVLDDDDNCPDDPNPGQEDEDGDGVGDVCDDDEPPIEDRDDDGIADDDDNCPDDPNPGQEDEDGDSVGDVCDNDDPPFEDRDDDGIEDSSDNCPDDVNPGQEDEDGDDIGDACDDEDPGVDVDDADAGCDCHTVSGRPAGPIPAWPLAALLMGLALLARRRE